MGCGATPKAAAEKATPQPKAENPSNLEDVPKLPPDTKAPSSASNASPKTGKAEGIKPPSGPSKAAAEKSASAQPEGGYKATQVAAPVAGKAASNTAETEARSPKSPTSPTRSSGYGQQCGIAPLPKQTKLQVSKPCLFYYPFAGRGELARLIAAAGDLQMDEKMELKDASPFGSPGNWPCLEHASLRISQTFAIESYLARIAPAFKDLTVTQRAEDAMFCKFKEEMIAGYTAIDAIILADESQKAAEMDDIAALGDKWFPVIEGRLPADGFINGLAFPTAADLAVLNIATGFIPFGLAYLMGKYDARAKFPKFASHAKRVAAFPAIKAYLHRSRTVDYAPVYIREVAFSIGDAVEVRDYGHCIEWKPARVTSIHPFEVQVDGWSWTTSWDEVRVRQVG